MKTNDISAAVERHSCALLSSPLLPSISESFLTVKGAALFLPRGNGPAANCAPRTSQRRNKHTGERTDVAPPTLWPWESKPPPPPRGRREIKCRRVFLSWKLRVRFKRFGDQRSWKAWRALFPLRCGDQVECRERGSSGNRRETCVNDVFSLLLWQPAKCQGAQN